MPLCAGMRTKSEWSPGPGAKVLGIMPTDDGWIVSAVGPAVAICPDCGRRSRRRHGWFSRSLQDLPVQGKAVSVKLRLSRWRCADQECKRRTFTDRLPKIASPYARRTKRVAVIVRLLGHSAGGLPAERLMNRLGMPLSDDTILRHLKHHAARDGKTSTRIVGIDDWSWRRSWRYGTIIVDLESREVVDVLAERTLVGTADWFGQHPEVEFVSRNRCGLYAQGAREGAPHVRQIADRFHLMQNLRLAIEEQLSRTDRSTGRALLAEADDEDLHEATVPNKRHTARMYRRFSRQTHRHSRQMVSDTVHALRNQGLSFAEIARQTGYERRSIARWLKCSAPPDRRRAAPKPTSPRYFEDYLTQRWKDGSRRGRDLFHEIRLRATPAASRIWSAFLPPGGVSARSAKALRRHQPRR